MVALFASPALAHGGDAPDASNFRSDVTGVVEVDADGRPVRPVTVPLVWRVEGSDALLVVEYDLDQELAVPGYDGEPYLRLSHEGVWENRNSPAAYLNDDRYAQSAVPPGVSADAEPDWVKVADGPSYGWHDHRIHWMAATLPPQVKTGPSAETVVQEWTVPFTFDGRRLAVQGRLRWIPPKVWWPWLGAALLVTTAPVVAGFAAGGATRRRRTLLRLAAVVLGVVAAVNVVHAVDDVVAMPATWGEHVYALAQSAAFIAIAAFGARGAWRAREGAEVALAVGAAALVLGVGLTHLTSLTSSQLVTVLPPGFTRLVVSMNLASIVPTGIVVWHTRKWSSRQADLSAASPAATP
jgi:hypothetical protein